MNETRVGARLPFTAKVLLPLVATDIWLALAEESRQLPSADIVVDGALGQVHCFHDFGNWHEGGHYAALSLLVDSDSRMAFSKISRAIAAFETPRFSACSRIQDSMPNVSTRATVLRVSDGNRNDVLLNSDSLAPVICTMPYLVFTL